MKLYHWKSQGIDLLIVADSDVSARRSLVAAVDKWRGQDPGRFDKVLNDLVLPPYFVADPGYPITIDSLERNP